jgi:hypothetical protein
MSLLQGVLKSQSQTHDLNGQYLSSRQSQPENDSDDELVGVVCFHTIRSSINHSTYSQVFAARDANEVEGTITPLIASCITHTKGSYSLGEWTAIEGSLERPLKGISNSSIAKNFQVARDI